jgi:hypothetical protein
LQESLIGRELPRATAIELSLQSLTYSLANLISGAIEKMTLPKKCHPTAAYRQEMRERREQRATAVLNEMAQRERARRVRYKAAMAAMAAMTAASRPTKNFKGFTPETINRIIEMKATGARSAEIAKAIGTTVNSLNSRCCQLGIKLSKRIEIAA